MIDLENPKVRFHIRRKMVELFGNTPFTRRLLDHIFHRNGHRRLDDKGIESFNRLIDKN